MESNTEIDDFNPIIFVVSLTFGFIVWRVIKMSLQNPAPTNNSELK